MKQLLVLRHAKSSWKDTSLDDHDRPLNKRGSRDATRIGRLVASERIVPDRIVSSTAKRAKTTALEVAEACGLGGDAVHCTQDLYLAGPYDYLSLLAGLDDDAQSVMVVGHNPGLEELVELLTGAGETMPTAALAWITLDVEHWGEVERPARGRLVRLWRPRELPADA